MRQYFYNHSKIEFYFNQNPDDFVVDEIPLYPFSGDGEHLVLLVRKKGLTTFELLNHISSVTGVKSKFMGYAGLKDKQALTRQYISLPKNAPNIDKIETNNIKILESTLHNNKIRIGHLKGNKFFIRIKKVNKISAKKIEEVVKTIKNFGIPNYFGYQRFGKSGDNFEEGKRLVEDIKKCRDKKRRTFLISAYQSHLFNNWLSKRVELSKIVDSFSPKELSNNLGLNQDKMKLLGSQKHPFKILNGDIMHHYPYGKIFAVENLEEESQRFFEKSIVPTGLICGNSVTRAKDEAWEIEKDFEDLMIKEDGSRRFAWIFVDDLEFRYLEDEAWGEFKFSLPKGCYATNLLEEICHFELKSGDKSQDLDD